MSIGVGDILRVVAILTWLDGDIMQNVFNAVISGSGGPYDEDDIVDDAIEWCSDMYDAFLAQISDELDGAEVRVYEYDSGDDDWDEIGSDVWVWNPASADEQLPRGVSLLLNMKTSNADVNGKKYLGGHTEASVTDGLFTAGEVSRGATFGATWATGFVGGTSGADWVPGVWSPKNTNFFAATGTIIIPTIPAYQRRRKQGVGI